METFITEDGLKPEISSILQTVFLSCDENNEGSVKVSKLMEFLKEKAITCEIFEFLDQLKTILDVSDKDPYISWAECESGMQKWIWYINNKNMQQDFVMNVRPNSISTPRVDVKTNKYNTLSPCSRKSLLMDKRMPTIMSIYSNDSIDVSELSWDCGDIHSRIEDLEITNRNLIGENTKLKEQLNVTEDVNTSMLADNEELQKQLTRFQKLLESNKTDIKRCNEFKTTTIECQNMIKELDNKVTIFEKENDMLQKLNESYANRISQMETNFDLLLDEKNKLNDDFVKEKANKADYLNKVITELSLNNEVLRAQKGTAERELSEIKQEVFHGYSAMDIIPEEMNCSSLLSSQTCDMKIGLKSLCQEIKAEMCPCSSRDNLWIDDSISGTWNRYATIFLEFKNNFKEKKDDVLLELDGYLNHAQILNGKKILTSVSNIESDLDSFLEQVSDLLKENLQLEKKLLDASENLKGLEAEKEKMNQSREKALTKLDNLSISTIENQEKLDRLRNEFDREKALLDESVVENVKLKENYEEEINSLNEQLKGLSENLRDYEELKTIVEDFENRNNEITKRLNEVEDNAIAKVEVSRMKNEEQLIEIRNHHENELQTIFNSIPLANSSSGNDDKTVTTEIIMKRINILLEELRLDKHCDKDLNENQVGVKEEKNELIEDIDESPPMFRNIVYIDLSQAPICDFSDEIDSCFDDNDKKSFNECDIKYDGKKELEDREEINSTEETLGLEYQQSTPCTETFPDNPFVRKNFDVDTNMDPLLVENYRKFIISFKADQFTLPQRLDNQLRLRDVAESVFDHELSTFQNIFMDIENNLSESYELQEVFDKLHEQLEVIQKSEKKVSQQSEQQGCYQQEYRFAPHIDIVISYVDHLRKYISKMEEELDIKSSNQHQEDTYSICTDTVVPSIDGIDRSDNSVFLKTNTISSVDSVDKDEPIFIPEKECKSVSFNDIPKKEVYSSSDPIKKTRKCSLYTPCKLLNNILIFLIIIGLVLYLLWISLEVDTKVCEAIKKYLPFDVYYSDLHNKIR